MTKSKTPRFHTSPEGVRLEQVLISAKKATHQRGSLCSGCHYYEIEGRIDCSTVPPCARKFGNRVYHYIFKKTKLQPNAE